MLSLENFAQPGEPAHASFRYVIQINVRVLDPFELGEDWFEILLPSLQLVLTDKVPPQQLQRAEFTLERLRLRDDERVLRQRQQWYQLYLDGDRPD